MILVIGTEHCSRCNMTKTILDNKNISYEYKLFDSLSVKEQENYTNIAKEKNQMSFPIIFKDNKLITLQEV